MMDNQIEALVDVATGTGLAVAVEPESGGTGPAKPVFCLNCGATVVGQFCSDCGQKAEVHRTLSSFWHDLVHGVFHFDGKIWRTLPRLALKPGELTRRYIHGERAKFVSPLALFLFAVFVMFAALNVIGGNQTGQTGPLASASEIRARLAENRKEWREEILGIESELGKASKQGKPLAEIRDRLAQRRAEIAELDLAESKRAKDREKAEKDVADQVHATREKTAQLAARLDDAEKAGQPTAVLRNQLRETQAALSLAETAQQAMSDKKSDLRITTKLTGFPPVDSAIDHVAENPQLFLYKIQSSAYKYSWVLILLSTPFVWLLFFTRRELKMFDHAVFVTYSICFMMLLFTFIMLTNGYGGWTGFLLLWVPIHVYKQLKYAYMLTRRAALWRTLVLGGFMGMVLSLFALLIIALGASG